jgi:hypothetical protein
MLRGVLSRAALSGRVLSSSPSPPHCPSLLARASNATRMQWQGRGLHTSSRLFTSGRGKKSPSASPSSSSPSSSAGAAAASGRPAPPTPDWGEDGPPPDYQPKGEKPPSLFQRWFGGAQVCVRVCVCVHVCVSIYLCINVHPWSYIPHTAHHVLIHE